MSSVVLIPSWYKIVMVKLGHVQMLLEVDNLPAFWYCASQRPVSSQKVNFEDRIKWDRWKVAYVIP